MHPLRRYQSVIGGPRSYQTLAYVGGATAEGVWASFFGHPLAYQGQASASGHLRLGGRHQYAGAAQAAGQLDLGQPLLRYASQARAAGRLTLGSRTLYAASATADGAFVLARPALAYRGEAAADGAMIVRPSLLLRYAAATLASGRLFLRDALALETLDHVYVINVESSAVSTYRAFALQSFAIVDGVAYGVGPDGLYVLGGNTRSGAPIASHVRTGLMPLGGNLQSRVEDVRLVMANNGQVVVKAGVVENGQINEYWYQPLSVPASATREQICKIGKGLASLYWHFEIHNQAGSAGEIAQIDLHPIPLSRRR